MGISTSVPVLDGDVLKLNRLALLFLIAGALLPTGASAQAYCALRDPVKLIYELFPDADGFQSIVQEIDREIADQLKSSVPFRLHRAELGKHTLYVATRKKEALGFVHVRSERSRWGLVEVAWGLEKDLRVRDYRVQKCRSRKRSAIEDDAIRKKFQGRSLAELVTWFDRTGQSFRGEALGFPEDVLALAEVLTRAGIKTIAVTELAWRDTLRAVQSVPASGDEKAAETP